MHTILRAFVTATIHVQEASETQIDQRGAKKTLGAVWSELPRLDAQVIRVAEELSDEPSQYPGDAHSLEPQWLKAIIDEVGTPSTTDTMDGNESWAWLARNTAWLAFCLAQAEGYASDGSYGRKAFDQVRETLAAADEFEKPLILATVTEAGTHFESTESGMARQIVEVYDRLIAVVS